MGIRRTVRCGMWGVCVASTVLMGSDGWAGEAARLETLQASARLVADGEAGSDTFRENVLSLFDSFPEVTPTYIAGKPNFTSLLMNSAGGGFDGFRFRTKPDYEWSFVWSFVLPPPAEPDGDRAGSMTAWYIKRRNGPMRGFTHIGDSYVGERYADVPWTDDRTVFIQQLFNSHLLPDEEYMIWFSFSDDQPMPIFVQVNLVPSISGSIAHTKHVIGLRPPPVEAPTADGPAEMLLHHAARGNLDQVAAALNQGVDVNATVDERGRSALALAVTGVNDELVAYLLRMGADVHCRDARGQTPLHWAVMLGRDKYAVLLLERGAEVNAKDNNGNTPLQLTLEDGRLELVQLLVEEGADLTLPNEYGQTPEQEARAGGHLRVADFLASRMR